MEPFTFPKNEAYEVDLSKIKGNTLRHHLQKRSSYTRLASWTSNLASSKSRLISRVSWRKSLIRKRDLMSLLRSYPMRITNDCASDAKLFTYFTGLLPVEIIRDAEEGERSCSISTDNYLVPEAILNLAADLTVHQLIQTLISICKKYHQCRNQQRIKYIRLSARSDVEKRTMMAKLGAALNDKQHMLDDILNSFHKTLNVVASNYPASAENQFRRHICQLLQLPVTEDNGILYKVYIEKEMSVNRYLVLLEDRDGGETVDPWKLGFCKTEFAGVLVLITTDSTMQDEDYGWTAESMDLEIRTTDHMLSWNFFCQMVGKEFVYASSAIMATAVRIVQECRGHLLVIALVAKWLSKNPQDVKYWELALNKMLHINPSNDDIQGHLSTIMNNTFLNLIWDSLNKAQKKCLLRCLFIPEIQKGKLDLALLGDWISSLYVDAKEAEQNLRHLLEISVLLQFESIGGRHIILPEETFEILQLMYSLNPFVNMSGLGLIEFPNTDQCQSALQIELANNKLSELPLSPNFPELEILRLQCNADLTKIPSSFFVHMPLLLILDLSYTSVRELPYSLFFLEQLKEFYLKGCERFMKLPPEIGNLQKLEKLDLDETQITHLPEEVQKLTCLQSLTLYLYEYRSKKSKPYSCSTIIPNGVLSKLKRLKHLSIGVNPDDDRWHANVQFIQLTF